MLQSNTKSTSTKKIRVRFAPSPTGALHIGGARTALYNFLFAKKHQGKIILRIEDTDQTRYVEGAEKHIKESLAWLGISFDESPDAGGPFSPYRQSERKNIYLRYATQLLEAGYAYMAFDSTEELIQMRQQFKKECNAQYDSTTRMHMKNSLTLSKKEVQNKLDKKNPFIIRLKVSENEKVVLHDLIRGKISTQSIHLDDKVLIKSDGMPTYHLAHVVDDYMMKISHVIRGEEWLPSTPFHTLIYKYLGWGEMMPIFAHLPLLLKPDGNGKLSKRDAQKMGFPILPIEWTGSTEHKKMKGFREEEYLPEALVNFLALLGWNPGNERELFTMKDLIEVFDIEKIGKSGAQFTLQKAKWFNQHYVRQIPESKLTSYLLSILEKKGIDYPPNKVAHIISVLKNRVVFKSNFFEMGSFFFLSPTVFDEKIRAKIWDEKIKEIVEMYKDKIEQMIVFSEQNITSTLNNMIRLVDAPKGQVMQAIRLALTGGAFGPDLIIIITILGKQETIKRLKYALKKNTQP